jgi:DNA polymerase-4
VVVDPDTELDFLHGLPVELMWGVGPATSARLAQIDVHTIGQLAKLPGRSLVSLLGHAAGEKLTALASNRDPREIRTHRRAQSAGAQSSRRSASNLRTSESSDPHCVILPTGLRPGFGRSPDRVEP